jgi:NAD(P)-dependent dehydrogenase (short-subunit alcohol dehydrogenase family)
MRLRGRTCIVTGATRGLGRAIARRFWEEGASLLLAGRDAAALRTLADSLSLLHSAEQRLAVALCDLSEPGAASALMSRATEEFDFVAALVNNAATLGPIGPLWENEIESWENSFRVNLLAPAALCRLVIPQMQRQGYGKIVNLSGGGATGPRPYFSAYAAAKAGLVRLTEVLAHETQKMNIDVNCIAPGVMRTGMLEEILDAGPDRVGAGEYAQAQAASRSAASLERAAELAVFLVSSDSDGISGRLISAVWDAWEELPERRAILGETDVYTLRRIVPKDRGLNWGSD